MAANSNAYRVFVVTDQRILVLDSGPINPELNATGRYYRLNGVVAELPRSTRLGPPSGAFYHVINVNGEKLRVPRGYFKDIRTADSHLAAELTAETLQRIDFGGTVGAVSWNPDGLRIAVAGITGHVRVYDASQQEPEIKWQVKADSFFSQVWVAFSPDGARLATAGTTAPIRIWDAATGQEVLKVRQSFGSSSVAFSLDGAKLATGSDDKTARIWPLSEV